MSTLGNATHGELISKSTLSGPVLVMPVMVGLKAAPVRVEARCFVYRVTRASEVSAVPSWNVMSGRSVRLHFVNSAFGVMDSARYGLTSEFTS